MDTSDSWESCYQALRQALNGLGKESAFGEGDFWLVDDNHGQRDQKVCVTKSSFLNRQMIDTVQSVLRDGFSKWRMFVVLEVSKLLDKPHKEGGLLIYPDRVEQHWDRNEIEAILGEPLVL